MYEILVVDDDIKQLNIVGQLLDQEGYDVLKARTAQEALTLIERKTPDMFVIDLSLPYMDGMALCRELRTYPEVIDVPIVFLNGNGQEATGSVTDALAAGGDDYVRRPFAAREFAARIRAHLRRYSNQLGSDIPQVRILTNTRQIFVNDREVYLTRVEFELLKYLSEQRDIWHTTVDLLANVWRYPDGVGDAALVRNHIRNLRRKLEDNPERPTIVQSRHGRGYIVKAYVQIAEFEAVR
jgi:DNA-binding response OmpR family regulator